VEVGGQLHASASHPHRETIPDAHWIGGWLSPRAGVGVLEKRSISFPCGESNPSFSALQAVAYRYTELNRLETTVWKCREVLWRHLFVEAFWGRELNYRLKFRDLDEVQLRVAGNNVMMQRETCRLRWVLQSLAWYDLPVIRLWTGLSSRMYMLLHLQTSLRFVLINGTIRPLKVNDGCVEVWTPIVSCRREHRWYQLRRFSTF
jgi:hypothetical protein